MKSIQSAVISLVAAWTTLSAVACSSSDSPSSASDAAADMSSGSSGSGGSSGSSGSSGGSGSSGASGSSGGSSSTSGSGSSGSSGTGDAGTCTSDADCGAGYLCGFPQSAGCSAVGTCLLAPNFTCQAIVLGCACDGTDMNIACNRLPGGYTPKPFAHSGTCGLDSGASDAGPTDARDLMDGAACVADGGDPCGAGLSCCPTAGYFGAPTACTPNCTGPGCAGSCRALP